VTVVDKSMPTRQTDRPYVVVECCPFCGGRHVHGAPATGSRVAHCGGGTYDLRQFAPEAA
jgi:hypothetical protein